MAVSKIEEHWTCETCVVELANRQAVVEHLRAVHGETEQNPQGKRSMISHVDGRDWYGGSDKLEMVCGAVLTYTYRAKRGKDECATPKQPA